MHTLTIKSFESAVGPTVDISERPEEVFQLFFNNGLQVHIVCESNNYARHVMGEEAYRTWTQLTVEELRAFFGFSILILFHEVIPRTIG